MTANQSIPTQIIPTGKRSKVVHKHQPDADGQTVPRLVIDPSWINHSWFIARVRHIPTFQHQIPQDVLAQKALSELGITSWYATGQRKLRRRRGRRRGRGNATNVAAAQVAAPTAQSTNQGATETNNKKTRACKLADPKPKQRSRMQTYLMYPGYLFIANDGNPNTMSAILQTRHLHGLLGASSSTGYNPACVTPDIMQALFAGEDHRHANRNQESEPLKQGERIQVVDGPLAHFDGTISRIITADRMEVILENITYAKSIEIPTDKLIRA